MDFESTKHAKKYFFYQVPNIARFVLKIMLNKKKNDHKNQLEIRKLFEAQKIQSNHK